MLVHLPEERHEKHVKFRCKFQLWSIFIFFAGYDATSSRKIREK